MTRARLEKLTIALTPVVALATVAIGLRTGASSRARGAKVYASPPGAGRPGVALHLVTLVEEGGVAEVVEAPGLAVVASAHGEEARWHGRSNREGMAAAWLDLAHVRPGDAVSISVTADDGVDLASGVIQLPAPTPDAPKGEAAVRPIRTSGPLQIDVFVHGGDLVPGAPESLFVRVRDAATRAALDGVALAVVPEPGLSIDRPPPPTSGGGWSEARVTADYLEASWTVSATPPGPSTEAGVWFGRLPVSPGAATVRLPASIPASTSYPLELAVPPATRRLYAEVDDVTGRDFAAVLEVTPSRSGGVARAELPPLAAGLYWLVTSSDARAAETMSGTAVARPFRVGAPPSELGPLAEAELARLSPPRTPRPLVLDGLLAPRRRAQRVRQRGMLVGLGSLAVAMVLETLLVLRAASRTRRRLLVVSDAAREAGVDAAPGAVPGVAVLLFVALLGLALTAGLLLMQGAG